MKLNGIEHCTISPYNLRANEAVKSVNRTVETMKLKDFDGATDRCEAYVSYVQLAYNCKITALTDATPFFLMFGGIMNGFESYGSTKTKSKLSLELWKKYQDNATKNVVSELTDRIEDKKKKDERLLNKTRFIVKEDAFLCGAKVMMQEVPKESKWNVRSKGQITVLQKNRGDAYVLRDDLGLLKRRVTPDYLKDYFSHEVQNLV